MTLNNILETYKIADEFCNLMVEFEEKEISRTDFDNGLYEEEASRFQEHDQQRELIIKEHRGAMMLGSIGYTLRHFGKMKSAQEYYSGGFGTTCPIKPPKE